MKNTSEETLNLCQTFVSDLLVHNTVEDENKESLQRVENSEDVGDNN